MGPTKEQLLDDITKTLHEMFDVDAAQIKPESRLVEDLDLDSIDAVDLIVRLQDSTGRKIKPDLFRSIDTIQDMVDTVHDVLQEPE